MFAFNNESVDAEFSVHYKAPLGALQGSLGDVCVAWRGHENGVVGQMQGAFGRMAKFPG